MTLEQAIKHYGSRAALAAVLKVKVTAVIQWKYRNGIPKDKQMVLQLKTRNKLKADK